MSNLPSSTFPRLAAALSLAAVTLAGVVGVSAQATGSISGTLQAPPRLRASAVVHVEHADGTFPPPAQPVAMDQRHMRFTPRVLPILVGTTVNFTNHDAAGHNVSSPEAGYNLGVFGEGEHASHTFDHEGVFTQLCRVHLDMVAFIVVMQNPYFAISAANGSFRIENVPPGTYHLVTWQQYGHGTPVDVTVRPGADTPVQIQVVANQ